MLTYGKTILSIVFGLCVITCDMDMGLGEEVDLTAPTMTVTRVVLPNDKTHDITTDGNKLYVGPGIKEGFTLEGESSDNVKIGRIAVEEIQKSVSEGSASPPPLSWNNATIGGRNANGIQEWSLYIDKIDSGERILKITAYDHVGNTGPDSVKTLTLLIDTEDPFIENITIERPSGQRVSPLPRESLETMDENLFANIDYFQNESFIVRAAVTHDFPLADVTLNLRYQGADDDEEKPLFSESLSRQPGSSLYAPSWLITAEDLINAQSALASGRHYLKIAVTATAAAGHSGNTTNLSYNLCWYPEMDTPRAEASKTDMDENRIINLRLGNQTPVSVSDDDNIGEVYAKMITKEEWDKIDGSDEAAKLAWYETEENYLTLSTNLLETPARNAVIAVESGKIHGEHRLVVVARDIGMSGTGGKWTSRVYPAQVIEDGIPVISITSPEAGTSPTLTDRAFTVKGSVTDVSKVESLIMAWIPDANMSIEDAKQALKANANTVTSWKLTLGEPEISTIGGKEFFKREFEQILKLDDFKVDNKLHNEAKRFILYTQASNGTDIFYPYSLLAHKTLPDIEIEKPFLKNNILDTARDANVPFTIKVTSPLGIPIKKVTLESEDKTTDLISAGNDTFTGTVKMESNDGFYAMTVRAVDELDNERPITITMNVSSWPELQIIETTGYKGTTTFSSLDTIPIQAVFNKGFSLSLNNTDKPTLTLEGIKNNGAAVTRYAEFTGGEGTKTLSFSYKVQAGDSSDGLQITHLDMKQAQLAANWNGSPIPADQACKIPDNLTPTVNLPKIDAIAPKITKIEISGDGDEWLMENQALTAVVTVNKEIQVLGSPVLLLKAESTVLKALYQSTDNDNKTMRFRYQTVKNVNGKVAYDAVFDEASLAAITDKAGVNGGNKLTLDALPTLSGDITIDTTPPPTLNVQIDPNGVNTNAQKDFIIVQNDIEANVQLEYTTDGYTWKNTWKTSPPPYTFSLEGDGVYQIAARQTDRAGNVSSVTSKEFTLGENGELLSITADVPDGVYNQGKITFKLFFNGKIDNATLASAKLEIGHNNGQYANGGNTSLYLMADTAYSLKAEFDIGTGLVWPELDVKNIDLIGVQWENQNKDKLPVPTIKYDLTDDVIKEFNDASAITVLTKDPAITSTLPENGIDNAGLSPSGDESILTLNFSHDVWPEKGSITVKPAEGWHIPPVLTNDEFNKIVNANPSGKVDLELAYKRTTHGLKEENGFMVPDTSTKYVLHFSKGLSDTEDGDGSLPTNEEIKEHLKKAKFLWQEIDVTIQGNITGTGTASIKVHLDKLPDGRKWEVEIPAGAFRDAAGNLSTADWKTDSTEHTFWSAQTAAPVIRVNRVSNNHPNQELNGAGVNNSGINSVPVYSGNVVVGAYGNLHVEGTVALPPGTVTSGTTYPSGVSGTKVQYRIDCETPGAAIKYITKEDLIADDNSPRDGDGNTSIDNASVTNLSALTIDTDYASNSPICTIGDNSLYTARKDYIAATATRTHLGTSVNGYEGAFKTVIVYRKMAYTYSHSYASGVDPDTYKYVKLRGSDQNGPPPTIPGFPLGLDYLSCTDTKFTYNNIFYKLDGEVDYTDHIWITWEIVSDFYQAGVKSASNGSLNPSYYQAMTNSIIYGDTFLHPRKYGNYGLIDFGGETF